MSSVFFFFDSSDNAKLFLSVFFGVLVVRLWFSFCVGCVCACMRAGRDEESSHFEIIQVIFFSIYTAEFRHQHPGALRPVHT